MTYTQALIRDIRVLLRIMLAVIYYWTIGARARRRYRDCEARGETYWLEDEAGRGLWEWKRKEDVE